MAPSSSSSRDFSNNTVNYSLDHSRAASSKKPDSASDLTNVTPGTDAEATEAMMSCCLEILAQPCQMLSDGVVGDKELQAKSQSVAGSTVGKHLRHVLDHFRLLMDALEAAAPGQQPVVDYDQRARSVPIETSSQTALDEFERTQSRVHSYLSNNPQCLHNHLTLHATTPILQTLTSTIGRELWFIALHSIHHFALARVILNELGVGDRVGPEFGVAPSTLVYREWGRASKDNQKENKAKL